MQPLVDFSFCLCDFIYLFLIGSELVTICFLGVFFEILKLK